MSQAIIRRRLLSKEVKIRANWFGMRSHIVETLEGHAVITQ